MFGFCEPTAKVGGYDYATREAAEGKCHSLGFEGLCSKAEVEGWVWKIR